MKQDKGGKTRHLLTETFFSAATFSRLQRQKEGKEIKAAATFAREAFRRLTLWSLES